MDGSVPDATQPNLNPLLVAMSSAVDAVRRDDWSAASAAIMALSEAQQRSAEARYVLARSQLALNQPVAALQTLHELETLVPELRDDIARRRAQALAKNGQHVEARTQYEALYARTHDDSDRNHAAIEALSAQDARAAAPTMRQWIDNAPSGLDYARALKLAGECLELIADNTGAIHAFKTLLIKEPDSDFADVALAALSRLHASLSREESLDRAARLNERARYQTVIDELTALGIGASSTETRRIHLLGRAYFGARNRYADAHTTLEQAASRADNPDREEDAFLAARALARADRDDEAVVAYDRVAQRIAGRWGHEAAFRAAWIVSRAGHTDAAVTRFRTFLQTRTDAQPAQRAETAWELGWVLFQAQRYAEAVAPLQQSADLAVKSLEKARGRYWAGLALARAADPEQAVRVWQALSVERPLTYYALLAEARLRERNMTVAQPPSPAVATPAPGVRFAPIVLWLRSLGFDREAIARLAGHEDSLRRGLPENRADEALAVGYLSLGYAQRSYAIAQRHGDDLDQPPTAQTRWVWDCAYPRPYAPWVEAAEDVNGLPRHYLFAIMRQESAFNGRDVSSARAIGLLQMIPPTTRRVARELGIDFQEDFLFDPAFNIRVGGHYIGRLYAQYQGVLQRSIGAYNAGPGAMGRWVRERATLELDAFVEMIPYDETRIYVRRVLQNLARYRYLHGVNGQPSSLELSISPPSATVTPLVDY
jgi:soluble lytic murein transglycosylase